MANVLTDEEDELTQDEEQRRLAAQQTIGSMPRPNAPPPQTLPASMPPPDVGATSPPANPTISEVAPYNPPAPPAPRPESQAFTDWQAQDLAKHPVGQPRYSGLTRAADTIANMTWPGQLAEEGGEFGTRGAEAKSKRLAGNAAGEDTQIKYGEQEREATGREEEQAARTATEKTGAEVQQLPLPGGGTAGVMTSKIGAPATAIINTAGRQGVADTNADARRDVANINADAKSANIRQPIRVMGNETYERTPEGNWKVVGPAPARAEQGNYIPVNDESGNTTGWADPKSGHFIRVDEIQGMGGPGEPGAGGVIPPKPGGAIAASEKSAQDSLNYAQQYITGGKFTGPGDEALLEQFFNVAKPSTGFRMSQPQISMLMTARSWMEGAEGQAYHAAHGTWFSDQQRKEIADTMIALAQSKGVGGVKSNQGKGSPASPHATGGPVSAGPQKFEDWVKTQQVAH